MIESNPLSEPLLIVFSGLPGTGKSGLARELATRMAAVYLRVDTIEQAIRNAPGVELPVNEEGYRVAYAVAEDNLRLGITVISDSVNPVQASRDAWVDIGRHTHSRVIEIEVLCSDLACHRQRVETRGADIPGLRLPTWEMVLARKYEPWNRDHIAIDTATQGIQECVQELQSVIANRPDRPITRRIDIS